MKKISTQLILSALFVCSTLFVMAQGQFTISSVSPTSGTQGATINLTVTGGTNVTFSTSGTCACTSNCVALTTGTYSGIMLMNGSAMISPISVVSASGNSFICSFTIPAGATTGAYSLSVTDKTGSGCIGLKSSAFTVNAATTGISNIENSNFNIFPNPSKGIFDVQLNNFTATNFADVFDLLGRKVETFTLTSEKTQIDASRFGKGVYFISIRNENGIVGRQKLVIE